MGIRRNSAIARRRRRARRLASACMVLSGLLMVLVFGVGTASANEEIVQWVVEPSNTQAGGHPDVRTFVEFHTHLDKPTDPCDCSDARLIGVHYPTGFTGDPHAVTRCSFAQFALMECPVDSQVGTAAGVLPLVPSGYVPVYNMETHPDQAGLVAFFAPLVAAPILVELSARTQSDYGLDAQGAPIFHLLPISDLEFNLWGVPADPSHDVQRFFSPPTSVFGFCAPYPEPCTNVTGAHSNLAPAPYLENPTSCGVPLSSGVDIEWYNGVQKSAEAGWPATTGCDLLSFNPSLTAEPTTSQTDTPSGLDVDVRVPQTASPGVPAPSEIKATRVTLPAGFSINPNAADGKLACTEAEGSFGTRNEAACPEHSKIGTSVLDSSALPAPINGGIYLGSPKPGDRYRIYLTADGYGTHVKLAGSVLPDPTTGQVTVSFPDLPQAPFSEFNLHFFGSERGLLATPTQCGTYEVHTDFTPWDSVLQEQHTTSYFTIDSGPEGAPCPNGARPFSPQVSAGTVNNTAGKHAAFVLRATRSDGEENLKDVGATLPPGLLASLKGVSYCPEAPIATLASPAFSGHDQMVAPICPESSRIGSVVAETGAGTHPLTSRGQVYLAGPYKGAPLSMIVVVPAVSGPYDLGNAVVRAAIHVDPTTTAVTAVSDPLPQIMGGIPLRTRSFMIDLDRPGFTLNPTNCSRMSIGVEVDGSEGARYLTNPSFQAANCATLGFGPKLGLKLKGGTRRTKHPALRAVLRTAPGEANIARTVVTLSNSELLDQAHIKTVCTRVQYAANTCPAGSVYGHATAITPLLDEPLTGPVYLRSSNHKLPDLVVALRGQFNVDLVARIDSVHGRLRTTFMSVPDAPVTKFVLQLPGGKKGLLQNGPGVCASHNDAQVEMKGQNGIAVKGRVQLQAACGKGAHHRKRQAHRRGRH